MTQWAWRSESGVVKQLNVSMPILHLPLSEAGGKGLFTKELDLASSRH
jgi:hypothetical protein